MFCSSATGRWLADEFEKEPFGWEFDAVRLLAVALLRAGKVDATSRGQVIDSAVSLDARNTFPNNNLFKQASFRPRVGIEFTTLVEAAEHLLAPHFPRARIRVRYHPNHLQADLGKVVQSADYALGGWPLANDQYPANIDAAGVQEAKPAAHDQSPKYERRTG